MDHNLSNFLCLRGFGQYRMESTVDLLVKKLNWPAVTSIVHACVPPKSAEANTTFGREVMICCFLGWYRALKGSKQAVPYSSNRVLPDPSSKPCGLGISSQTSCPFLGRDSF
jgi:hypothetical protein